MFYIDQNKLLKIKTDKKMSIGTARFMFYKTLIVSNNILRQKRSQTWTFILPLFFSLFHLLVCCQILVMKSLTGESLVRSSFVWDLRNQVRLHLPKSPPVFCKPLSSNSISTSSFIIYACIPPPVPHVCVHVSIASEPVCDAVCVMFTTVSPVRGTQPICFVLPSLSQDWVCCGEDAD